MGLAFRFGWPCYLFYRHYHVPSYSLFMIRNIQKRGNGIEPTTPDDKSIGQG
jgi:hypothetical protein